MIGRLQQAADFQRLLDTPPKRRSAHFCLHFVSARPTRPAGRVQAAAGSELSTGCEQNLTAPVDKSIGPVPVAPVADGPVDSCWLGCLVPKRHARRAVTRSLLKRQMRAAAERHAQALAPALWLLRLRSGFATAQFPSAASQALRLAARQELDSLLQGRGRPAT